MSPNPTPPRIDAGPDACPACAARARAEAILAGVEAAGETPPPPRPGRAALTRPDGRLWILRLPPPPQEDAA